MTPGGSQELCPLPGRSTPITVPPLHNFMKIILVYSKLLVKESLLLIYLRGMRLKQGKKVVH